MKVVWKYKLDHGPNRVGVTAGYRIVHVGMDPKLGNLTPVVWIENDQDPQAQGAQITLQFFGTGHPIPGDAEHVGSTVERGGLVWHVYKVKP